MSICVVWISSFQLRKRQFLSFAEYYQVRALPSLPWALLVRTCWSTVSFYLILVALLLPFMWPCTDDPFLYEPTVPPSTNHISHFDGCLYSIYVECDLILSNKKNAPQSSKSFLLVFELSTMYFYSPKLTLYSFITATM